MSLNEKLDVYNILNNKKLGEIEIVANSIYQQISLVFEEGGGLKSEIDFGSIYYGERKEINGYLVNNGPLDVYYFSTYYADKLLKDINLKEVNFANTPYEQGIEETNRQMLLFPTSNEIKSFEQTKVNFSVYVPVPNKTKGWNDGYLQANHEIKEEFKKKGIEVEDSEVYEDKKATIVIKFENAKLSNHNPNNWNKNANKDKFNTKCSENTIYPKTEDIEDNFSNNKESSSLTSNIIVQLKCKVYHPKICFSRTNLNFWECKSNEHKTIQVVISNLNQNKSVDFEIPKIPYFNAKPNKGIINDYVTVDIIFHPETLGTFSSKMVVKYNQSNYKYELNVIGICKKICLNKSKNNNLLIKKKGLENNLLKFNNIINKESNDNTRSIVPDSIADNFTFKLNVNDEYYSFNKSIKNNINNNSIKNSQAIDNIKDKKFSKFINNLVKSSSLNKNINKILPLTDTKNVVCKSLNKNMIKEYKDKYDLWLSINEFNNLHNKNIRINNTLHFKNNNNIEKPQYRTTNIDTENTYSIKLDSLNFLNSNNERELIPSKINIINQKEELYVVKPIGNYEPKQNYIDNNFNSNNYKETDIPDYFNEDSLKKNNRVTDLDLNSINNLDDKLDLTNNNVKIKNLFNFEILNSYPITVTEIRECSMDLNSKDLIKIDVKSKELNFGTVFVNSYEKRTLWIKNYLKTSIFVQIECTSIDINKSYPTSLIIHPGNIEGFIIILNSMEIKEYDYLMRYTINYKYSFKARLLANIIPVTLTKVNDVSKFDFKDQDIGAPSMIMTKTLELLNNGNALAFFKIEIPSKTCFSYKPMNGKVKPNCKQFIDITLDTKKVDSSDIGIDFTELMNIIIEGGSIDPVLLTANIPKSELKLKSEIVEFGHVHVGSEDNTIFYIENILKNLTVYQFESSSNEIKFIDNNGYIKGHDHAVTCCIKSDSINEEFIQDAKLIVRGGNTIHFKVKASIIAPNVIIEQDIFDFGHASSGENITRNLTFVNLSDIKAKIEINLSYGNDKNFSLKVSNNKSNNNNYNIKDLEYLNNSFQEDESNFEISNNKEGVFFSDNNYNINKTNNDNYDSEDEIEEQDKVLTHFELEIDKNSKVDCDFIFSPLEDIANSDSSTALFNASDKFAKFKLIGCNDNNKDLIVPISAYIVRSAIKTNPDIIEFKKTFIFNDRINQSSNEITIINTSGNIILWKLDTSNTHESIFCSNQSGMLGPNPNVVDRNDLSTIKVNKLKGLDIDECDIIDTEENFNYKKEKFLSKNNVLDIANMADNKPKIDYASSNKCNDSLNNNNLSNTKLLKFSFTPTKDELIETSVSLLIEQDGQYVHCKKITIKALGALPRLYFDRKEVIMPIVPLNIPSFTRFKVKNEGIEECKLSIKLMCEGGAVPLEYKFVDDNNSIGVIKNDATIELKFQTNKPLSFTAKLIIYSDDDYNIVDNYEASILVSATSENCLITNYSFYEKYQLYFNIANDKNSINLKLKDGYNFDQLKALDYDDRKSMASFSNLSITQSSSVLSGNARGYSMILRKHCDYLLDFISYVVSDTAFSAFPDNFCNLKDFCESLYRFIEILSNKALERNEKKDIKNLKDELSKIKYNKNEFIHILIHLQKQGALLNTVNPDYLFEYKHFVKIVNENNSDIKILPNKWEKKLKNKHKILHLESWITLIYQIIKIYYLSRINNKFVIECLNLLPEDKANQFFNIKGGDVQVNCQYNYNSNLKSINHKTVKDKNKKITKSKNNKDESVSPFLLQAINSINLPSSNIYSKEELLLLKLMQFYFNISYCNNKKLTNFSDDYNNYQVLYSLFYCNFSNLEEFIKTNNKKKVVNDQRFNVNSEKILTIMMNYGIYTHFKQSYLNNINSREIVLFNIMLLQNIVNFVPRGTITFTGILGDKINKVILLNNPTEKPIEYMIKKEGCDDFKIESSSDVIINPKEEIRINLCLNSRLSKKVKGKIYFINKMQGFKYQSVSIIYNLESDIISRKPENEIIEISSPMYVNKSISVLVKNKYKERAEYSVFLNVYKDKNVLNNNNIDYINKYSKDKSKTIGKSLNISMQTINNNNKFNKDSHIPYPVFYLDLDIQNNFFKLESEQKREFEINFLPISQETFYCDIIFYSESVGEFQYTVKGKGEFPILFKKIDFEAYIDEYKDVSLSIPFVNKSLEDSLLKLKKSNFEYNEAILSNEKLECLDLNSNKHENNVCLNNVVSEDISILNNINKKVNLIKKTNVDHNSYMPNNVNNFSKFKPISLDYLPPGINNIKKTFHLESDKPYALIDAKLSINLADIWENINHKQEDINYNEIKSSLKNKEKEENTYDNKTVTTKRSNDNHNVSVSQIIKDANSTQGINKLKEKLAGKASLKNNNTIIDNLEEEKKTTIKEKNRKVRLISKKDESKKIISTNNNNNNNINNDNYSFDSDSSKNKTNDIDKINNDSKVYSNKSPNTKKLTFIKHNKDNKISKNTIGYNAEQQLFSYRTKVNCKYIGKFLATLEADIIVRCIEDNRDIRVFKLFGTIKPKKITANIEFSCPYGQTIEQRIPIVNNSDKDWFIKAELIDVKTINDINLKSFDKKTSSISNKLDISEFNTSYNNINEDNELNNNEHNNIFITNGDFKINKKSEDAAIIYYKPINKLKTTAKLILNNAYTRECYEYTLIGNVEDPLAEGSIELEGYTNETLDYSIKIENNTLVEAQYRVETDLSNIIAGQLTFHIKPNSYFLYNFKITPLLGKVYFGRLTFINVRNNMFKWYTIKVNSISKYNTKDPIYMCAEIRQSVYIEIEVENKSDSSTIFNVEYFGQYLLGDNQINIESKSIAKYKLYFSPLRLISIEGKLQIYNDILGEFIYKLNLESTEPAFISLDTLECELGKYIETSIRLDNPTNEYILVDYEYDFLYNYIGKKNVSKKRLQFNNTNNANNIDNFLNSKLNLPYINSNNKPFKNSSHNIKENISISQISEVFKIIPNKIVIPPIVGKEIIIRYSATLYNNLEEYRIIFTSNNKIGDWVFNVTGKGIHPKQMDKIYIHSYVGGVASNSIIFKNPFKEKIEINIKIDDINNEEEDTDVTNNSNNNENNKKKINNTTGLTSDIIDNSYCDNSIAEKMNIAKKINKNNNYKNNYINNQYSLNEENAKVFKILLKNKKYELEGFKTITIPFCFTPKKVLKYSAILSVTYGSLITWSYPIEGITEIKSHAIDFILKTKSKNNLLSDVSIDLFDFDPGYNLFKEQFKLKIKPKNISQQDLINKTVSFEIDDISFNNLKFINSNIQSNNHNQFIINDSNNLGISNISIKNNKSNIVLNSITNNIDNNYIKNNIENSSLISNANINNNKLINLIDLKDKKIDKICCNSNNITNNDYRSKELEHCILKLPLKANFYPLKPFKSECELVIIKKGGGQWVFNFLLEATQGDPEDIIRLESTINQSSSVEFSLHNLFTKTLNFKAYLTHTTSSEISITPSEGVLNPIGNSPAEFIISFKPVEYGKRKKGYIIIDTEDIQWVFEVIAKFCEYKKPIPIKSTLMQNTANVKNRILANDKMLLSKLTYISLI